MNPTPVVLLHDGAIDEFVAAAMLLTAPEVDLVGTIVVNGDCVGVPALTVNWKIQQLLGQPTVPIGLSASRAVNAFPWSYRGDCVAMESIASLRGIAEPAFTAIPDGDALLEQLVEQHVGLTVLALGPVTPLTDLLLRRPDLESNIRAVVWMAGAITVAGNLDPSTLVPGVANPFAEWNVFWDPYSADTLISDLSVPTTLVPLDVSNQVPLTIDLRARLLDPARTNPLARLALDAYSLVNLPAELFYRLWDTSTVAWLLEPSLFAPVASRVLAVETDPRLDVGALVTGTGHRAVDYVPALGPDGAGPVQDFVLSRLIAEVHPTATG